MEEFRRSLLLHMRREPCQLQSPLPQAIASEVGVGRSAANCLQRWSRRGLGTALKKGKWDQVEDQALLQVLSKSAC